MACSAYGCSNRTTRKAKRQKLDESIRKITFHRFPKNPEQRQEWIDAVRRKDWEPSSNSILCSEHFGPECFDRTSLSSVRLRENSIPTIFPAFHSYLQKESQNNDSDERIEELSEQLKATVKKFLSLTEENLALKDEMKKWENISELLNL